MKLISKKDSQTRKLTNWIAEFVSGNWITKYTEYWVINVGFKL